MHVYVPFFHHSILYINGTIHQSPPYFFPSEVTLQVYSVGHDSVGIISYLIFFFEVFIDPRIILLFLF